MPATHPFIPRILLAFDFDRTLATDSIDAVCEEYGISREDWTERFEEALGEDWDGITRRGQALIDMGGAMDRPLSDAVLRDAARRVRLYDGVLEMPDRLRAAADEVLEGIDLEFVVLSSGYAKIIEATEVMDVFDRVLASAFHNADDEGGTAICVKRVVAHPQKALYLEALGKGVGIGGSNAPERAGDPVDEHDMHCPFDQMIYLGDGASDLQAFGFLNENAGLTIAIDKDRDFDAADEQAPAQRVDNLAPPTYVEGSELLDALRHAVKACAHRIALRKMSRGE